MASTTDYNTPTQNSDPLEGVAVKKNSFQKL